MDNTTSSIFNRQFWESRNIIVNALDNIEARKFVDSKVFLYSKVLFESGTLGNKGNVQTIDPYITALYSDIEDPPSKEIPVCTIKNFPNKLEHCVQWGLELFNTIFIVTIKDYNNFLDNRLLDIMKIDNENERNQRLKNLYVFSKIFINKKDINWKQDPVQDPVQEPILMFIFYIYNI